MIQTQAFIPQLISQSKNQLLTNILSIASGIALLSFLAQISIPLPWTPVPITGQTFGVTLIALAWGSKRAFTIVLGYLFLGFAGLPILAGGAAGFSLAPTLGYLVGMSIAALWMGFLADKGWTKKWLSCWLAGISGSLIVFTFGVIGLSFFVSSENLFALGILPFLPGDFIKTLTACTLVFKTQNKGKKK